MGRRNQHNPSEFDDLVLTQIASFLENKPANELSLRKVANLIDYAPSTLVSVYGNYANLLLRFNAKTLECMNQQLTACLNSQLQSDCPKEASDRLYRLAKTYYHFAVKHPNRWQLIFDLRMPGDDPLPQWIQDAIDYSFELLMQCLRQINSNKTENEIQLACRVLWAGVHGITQLSLEDKLFLNQNSDGVTMIHSLLDNYLTTWAQPQH